MSKMNANQARTVVEQTIRFKLYSNF
jgi:hypothetical protein